MHFFNDENCPNQLDRDFTYIDLDWEDLRTESFDDRFQFLVPIDAAIEDTGCVLRTIETLLDLLVGATRPIAKDTLCELVKAYTSTIKPEYLLGYVPVDMDTVVDDEGLPFPFETWNAAPRAGTVTISHPGVPRTLKPARHLPKPSFLGEDVPQSSGLFHIETACRSVISDYIDLCRSTHWGSQRCHSECQSC